MASGMISACASVDVDTTSATVCSFSVSVDRKEVDALLIADGVVNAVDAAIAVEKMMSFMVVIFLRIRFYVKYRDEFCEHLGW